MTHILPSDLAERIDRGVPMRPCPPFCTEHFDAFTTSTDDYSPGSAAHQGRRHMIVGTDDAPSRCEREVSIQMFAVRNDYGRRATFDDRPHAWLFCSSADGMKLTAAGLRELAAAALAIADEIEQDGTR